MRLLLRLALIAVATGLAGLAWGHWGARADPVVRRAAIGLPDWPPGAPPVTVALISDIHIGNAEMDRDRLRRIVDRLNAHDADLVVIAGDFVAGHEPGSAARLAPALTMPLSRIAAPLGVVAVPGNHDHWTGMGGLAPQLAKAGVVLLSNSAVVRGPLAIGGVDDEFSGHADVAETLAGLRRLPGARVLLTHSPDIAPRLPRDTPLLLAGRTHCGQAVLPLIGAISHVSRYGERYRCGIRREAGRTVITTAGLGTSVVPLRYFAPPDLWLLTLGPVTPRP